MEGRVFQVVRVRGDGKDGEREIVGKALCAREIMALELLASRGGGRYCVSLLAGSCAIFHPSLNDHPSLPPSDAFLLSRDISFKVSLRLRLGREDDLLTCALKSVFNGLDGEG